jgi:hypothetical protein
MAMVAFCYKNRHGATALRLFADSYLMISALHL